MLSPGSILWCSAENPCDDRSLVLPWESFSMCLQADDFGSLSVIWIKPLGWPLFRWNQLYPSHMCFLRLFRDCFSSVGFVYKSASIGSALVSSPQCWPFLCNHGFPEGFFIPFVFFKQTLNFECLCFFQEASPAGSMCTLSGIHLSISAFSTRISIETASCPVNMIQNSMPVLKYKHKCS